MKYFRHYKNKPYRFIGEAKHSETLEDMVIYETRYENAHGKVWVRPKQMFFEKVVVGGSSQDRFAAVPLQLSTKSEVDEKDIDKISILMKKVFGQWDSKWFHSTFNAHEKYCLIFAKVEEEVVGFKIGFATGDCEFYSWLGGVVPEYRGLGIAVDLMEAQHKWCKDNGYTKVQTKTQNRFREMLMLNIRFGFDIVGYESSNEGGPKIILEKNL